MRPEEIDAALEIAEPFIARFEGVYLKPYLCPAGKPTIGVGSTRYLDGTPVRMTDQPITRSHAMILLRESIKRVYLTAVLRLCPGLDTPERLAAILSFAYNLGVGALKASTLRKRINTGEWDKARKELMRWVRCNGKALPGLVKRRMAEAALIGTGYRLSLIHI